MTSNELVVLTIQSLESFEIPYMLVGSYSSNAYGIVRSTQDADFVIELGDKPVTPLFSRLLPHLKFDPQLSFESVTLSSRYVGTHSSSTFKVELFLLTDDPHNRERFRRRQRHPFFGTTAFLPSPEDVIIQKLRWFARARRAKDFDDIRNVLAVQEGQLDLPYIRNWADQHRTRDAFEKILILAAERTPGVPTDPI